MNAMQLYVVWDIKFKEGLELARHIFKTFNKDINNSEDIGMGIPVYYINSVADLKNINQETAEKTVVIILIDDYMVLSPDWVRGLKKIENNIYSIYVALEERALNISSVLRKINFLRLYESAIPSKDKITNIELLKEKLIFELSQELNRLLYKHKKESIKIFISYAKQDGAILANQLRRFIYEYTRLAVFLDSKDIPIGEELWSSIEGQISGSSMIVINSNKYAHSEWCKQEIIAAKKSYRPIIIVKCGNKKKDTTYPYLYNVPEYRISERGDGSYTNEDMKIIIQLILMQTLKIELQKRELDLLKKTIPYNENIKVVPWTPELLDIALQNDIQNKNIILYPEPPMGNIELQLIKNIIPNKEFITPTLAITREIDIRKMNIGFSVSEGDEEDIIKQELVEDIISELMRYILYLNGGIIYGGDIKYQAGINILDIMIKVLKIYENKYLVLNKEIDMDEKYIINYTLNSLDKIESLKKNAEVSKFIEFREIHNNLSLSQNEQLSRMRHILIDKADVYIMLGGKYKSNEGKQPGIVEEFFKAIELKKPIFLLGGLGGCCREISKILSNSSYYSYKLSNAYSDPKIYYKVEQKIREYGMIKLNNGLSIEENQILFETESRIKILQLIFKGIKQIYCRL